jgi:hypothetical protein
MVVSLASIFAEPQSTSTREALLRLPIRWYGASKPLLSAETTYVVLRVVALPAALTSRSNLDSQLHSEVA